MFLLASVQVQSVQSTTIETAVITSIGLIVVALIGVWTAHVTSGARRNAVGSSARAEESAKAAEVYLQALNAKNAFIETLEERLMYIEDRLEECESERRREADQPQET